MTPEHDPFDAELMRPRRLGRRTAVAWVILGAIAALLIWVAHRLQGVAA